MPVDYAEMFGLIKAVSEGSVCPVCGGNEWRPDRIGRLSFVDEASGATKDEGPEMIPVGCVGCSFTRLYSLRLLEEIAEDLKERLAKGNGHV